MFHWLLFTLATIFTISGVIISYTPSIRESSIGIIIGVLLALFTNLIWFIITRLLIYPEKIYKFGAVWDLMFAASWFILPIILFQVKLDTQGFIGLLLVVIGVVLLNVGKLF